MVLVDGCVYRKLRRVAADIAAGTSLRQLPNDVAYHQFTQTAVAPRFRQKLRVVGIASNRYVQAGPCITL